jgi:hypothetical protein
MATPGSFGRPGSQTEFRGSKASEDGTPRFARPGSETQFRGSKASEDSTPRFARPGSDSDPHGPASASRRRFEPPGGGPLPPPGYRTGVER